MEQQQGNDGQVERVAEAHSLDDLQNSIFALAPGCGSLRTCNNHWIHPAAHSPKLQGLSQGRETW